jgi:hypothetical protein
MNFSVVDPNIIIGDVFVPVHKRKRNKFASDSIDADKNEQNDDKIWNIHVFMGGAASVQAEPFAGGLQRANFPKNRVNVVKYNVKKVKELQMTLVQFIDWLLSADCHLILSHVHQGLSQLNWSLTEVVLELQRLKHHRGFPNGDQLLCPVFLQDKYSYIKSLPCMTNPTLKIDLTMHGELPDAMQDEILRYVVHDNNFLLI